MLDRQVPRQFIEALFPEVPDDAAVLIWTLAGRKSFWARTHDEAVEMACSSRGDVYIGACLGPRGLSMSERASATEVVWMSSLWLDLDFRATAHQKLNLPPDEAAARELLDRMPLVPSVVVHSGHGLQAWWLLKEMVDLRDGAARHDAAVVERRWNRLLIKRGKERGWTVDSVYDLARVMRMPGTVNTKGQHPVPVKVLVWDGPRYCLDDFDQFLPADDEPDIAGRQAELPMATATAQFELRPAAEPPFAKWEAAMANDERFHETWDRKRRDIDDNSASGYDLSLATQSVIYGWSDQEIVDMLVAFRRKYSQPKLRVDYYRMTLAKARRVSLQEQANERIDELADMSAMNVAPDNPAGLPPDEATRAEALATLSQWFGYRVICIEQTKSEEPLYMLRTERGDIKIGGIGAVMSQQVFSGRVAAATGVIPAKRKDWRKLAQVVLNARVIVDVGHEATDAGAAQEWLAAYLRDYPPIDQSALAGADEDRLAGGYPFLRAVGGRPTVYVTGAHFRSWLRSSPGYGERVNNRDLGVLLRSAGATPGSVRCGGQVVHAWAVMEDTLAPREQEAAPRPPDPIPLPDDRDSGDDESDDESEEAAS